MTSLFFHCDVLLDFVEVTDCGRENVSGRPCLLTPSKQNENKDSPPQEIRLLIAEAFAHSFGWVCNIRRIGEGDQSASENKDTSRLVLEVQMLPRSIAMATGKTVQGYRISSTLSEEKDDFTEPTTLKMKLMVNHLTRARVVENHYKYCLTLRQIVARLDGYRRKCLELAFHFKTLSLTIGGTCIPALQ